MWKAASLFHKLSSATCISSGRVAKGEDAIAAKMPSVDVAMERSLRPGVVDGLKNLLSASLRPALARRDAITNAQSQISDVKTAFSSWGNCMNAVYCKYASPSSLSEHTDSP